MTQSTPLLKTTGFRVALGIPLLLAIVLVICISVFGLGEAISSLFNMYKIPLTIASLSLPLVAWSIADHRSQQTIRSLMLQTDKRLFEMYQEQSNHFTTIVGRRIQNSKFLYLNSEDLPLIFSELYEYKNLKSKGEVSLNPEAVLHLQVFFESYEAIITDFYSKFSRQRESSKQSSQMELKYIIELFAALQHQIGVLSERLGTPFIDVEDANLNIFRQAYFNIKYLAYFLGDEFESVYLLKDEGNGLTNHDLVHDTFNAIDMIIRDSIGLKNEDISWKLVIERSRSREIEKFNCYSPLGKQYVTFLEKFSEFLSFEMNIDDIRVYESDYPIMEFLHDSKGSPTFIVHFLEKSHDSGKIQFSGLGTLIHHDMNCHNNNSDKVNSLTPHSDPAQFYIDTCRIIKSSELLKHRTLSNVE